MLGGGKMYDPFQFAAHQSSLPVQSTPLAMEELLYNLQLQQNYQYNFLIQLYQKQKELEDSLNQLIYDKKK